MRLLRFGGWLAALGLCGLAACGPAPRPEAAGEPPSGRQPVILRVLDEHDRPVAGARLELRPLAGTPDRPGPYLTDATGQLRLEWQPLVKDETEGRRSRDYVFTQTTQLEYVVAAPGFITRKGAIKGLATSTRVASAELKSLNRDAVLVPLSEVVVLARQGSLLGGELAKRADSPEAKRLIAFWSANQEPLRLLGLAPASPALVRRGGELALRLEFDTPIWGGLRRLPLKNQLLVNGGLPAAVLLGRELAAPPGVERLVLEIGAVEPPRDQYALPGRLTLTLAAPPAAFANFAQGAWGDDDFLLRHPPSWQSSLRP